MPTNDEYYIGQIFHEKYPPEAAIWCNNRGDCYITEIEFCPIHHTRRFQIVAQEIPPEPTFEEEQQRYLENNSKRYTTAVANGHMQSTLEYPIATDNAAKSLMASNITLLGILDTGSTVEYTDYVGGFHQITLDNAKTLLKDMVDNDKYLQEQRAEFITQIQACTTKEELYALDLTYKYLGVNPETPEPA